jgi:hypothetical protein
MSDRLDMNQAVPSYTINKSAPSQAKKNARQAVGYLFAIACLSWVFYDINFKILWQSMPGINWWLVVLAVIFDILSYVVQGLRWQQLLHTAGTITTLRATQAVYAGLFVNEIVPMRIGELVRRYLVSQWLSVKFIAIIPSVAIERFFDALWLAAGIIPRFLCSCQGTLKMRQIRWGSRWSYWWRCFSTCLCSEEKTGAQVKKKMSPAGIPCANCGITSARLPMVSVISGHPAYAIFPLSIQALF